MNCPVCDDTRMREVEKNGVLIDVCPSCKGVWLDRGELDKLMSDVREVKQDYNNWYYGDSPQQQQTPPPQFNQQPSQTQQPQYNPNQQQYNPNQQQYYSKHKKKKSVMDMFGDLFD